MRSSKKTKTVQKPRRVERVLDPRFMRCYANNAQVESTPMDFKIRFGEIDEASDERILIREVVHVSMSPQHAFSFFKIFKEILDKYKAQIEADVSALDSKRAGS